MSGASAQLEQEEGEATFGENLPPVLEKRWHEFSFIFHEFSLEFFTRSRFVSAPLDSDSSLLRREGFRCLLSANYRQRLRDAVLTSA